MALVYDTPTGPTIGTGYERTAPLHAWDYDSVNGLLDSTNQTAVLTNNKNVKILVLDIDLTEVSNNSATFTIRKKAITESDANSQRLAVTQPIAALGVNTIYNGSAKRPVLVLHPGEALYITASAANRIAYNIPYKWERT